MSLWSCGAGELQAGGREMTPLTPTATHLELLQVRPGGSGGSGKGLVETGRKPVPLVGDQAIEAAGFRKQGCYPGQGE